MRLVVARSDGREGAHEATYEVPEFEGMTVLDALIFVRENVDPTLGIRYSCRCANACKQCLALIDGVRTYTCTVRAVGEVHVAPLPNRPLVRDLVVKL